MALIHGGQLLSVAKHYSIAIADWLDLSTGIAPFSYPIPPIPNAAWQNLPQDSPSLTAAAQNYYQTHCLYATNGSQAIIKQLPALWQVKHPNSFQVYLPKQGYKEHEQAWRQAGFTINYYADQVELNQIEKHAVVVVINPNNPTGYLTSKNQLTQLLNRVTEQQGLLIVDEAFIDIYPNTSSMLDVFQPSPQTNQLNQQAEHLIVLRSIGKFFGLAGIRIGFVMASEHWLSSIQHKLGPWQVNGPAQVVAEHALANTSWQQTQKQQLAKQAAALELKLKQYFPNAVINGTDLFKTVYLKNAQNIYHKLCQQGIYVRLTDHQDALRFGIPTSEQLDLLNQRLSKLQIK